MSKLSANEIKLALAHLTKEERAEIATFAKLGGDTRQKTAPKNRPRMNLSKGRDFDEKFLLYYAKFREILNSLGSNLPRHPGMLSPSRVSSIKKGWRAVDDYMTQCFPKRVRIVDRVKFYRIVIEVTIDYLNEIKRPTSIRQVNVSLQNCAG